jgi:hypothetical protein
MIYFLLFLNILTLFLLVLENQQTLKYKNEIDQLTQWLGYIDSELESKGLIRKSDKKE